VHVAGSERRFVRRMNRRARQLGLRCTRFASSYGLESGNRSCPADLAALTRLAMRRSRIARVVRKKQASVRFPVKGGRLFVNTTNPLILSDYSGTIGLKTGYTKRAGRCYVAVVRRGGRTWGVVLLRSPNPASQAKRLVNAAVRRTAS
jgi:D-alanyl-D-alanine carboxypeptidase (penicillin-binding protein 5/6)